MTSTRPAAAGRSVAILALILLAPVATAQDRVPFGTLSCTVSGKMGVFIVAQKTLACTFDPAPPAARETYTGLVARFDPHAGAADRLDWEVRAPAVRTGGALAGSYERPNGRNDALVNVDQTVLLAPLSTAAQAERNVTAGVAELHLWFER